MAQLFKIHSINSDGTDVPSDSLIEFQPLDSDTGKPLVGVGILLKPISQQKYRQVVREHTDTIPARKGQPPRQETDWDAVQDALVVFTVDSWHGIIGADDKPLQCVLDAKLALPGELKNEIVAKAMRGEAVDAASFRSAS